MIFIIALAYPDVLNHVAYDNKNDFEVGRRSGDVSIPVVFHSSRRNNVSSIIYPYSCISTMKNRPVGSVGVIESPSVTASYEVVRSCLVG